MKNDDSRQREMQNNPSDVKELKVERTVPADNFMGTIAANVDNQQMSDREFRAFIRRTLPIVRYCGAEETKKEVT